jgi:HTH-type transcriptional regulator/antitoxin HigA
MATRNLAANVSGYAALLLEYSPRPIRSERQYQRVMRQIDELMRKPKLNRAQDNLLEVLAALVTQYEQKSHLAPDVTPGKMVMHLIEVRGVTKAHVARETGIPRQTITNIVSGTRGISKANRDKLADFFCVSPDVFVDSE